jgi:hypothetical protein
MREGVLRTAPGDGVEQGDDRTIGDQTSGFDGNISEERPERRGWKAVLPEEIAGNPRFGISQRLEDLPQRAGLERQDQVHGRPAQDHTRRARQGHLNPHAASAIGI